MEYPWPGNVRELENIIRRMVVLADGEHAFEALVERCRNEHAAAPRPTAIVTESLREIARRGAREAERQALVEVLERAHWNRAEAARILKVSYKTLLNKISEHGVPRDSKSRFSSLLAADLPPASRGERRPAGGP